MIPQDAYFLPPSAASINGGFIQVQENFPNPNPNPNPNPDTPSGNNNNKRKRNLPRSPDPEVEVVAMSPKTLMATNRFLCEICNKGFQRDQNLQLHRRGHNLPWKLKQKPKDQPVKKKVYVCPEKSCVHNDPSRALGDLTGIKKHFSRKHGEKKWKCDKCSKKYAVMSDWKAHTKICGTREYKCDCGTIFSRKDSFITHRAFCDALTEERMRVTTNTIASALNPMNMGHDLSSGLIMGNRQSNIPSFSASQRPGFLGFDPSSSTSGNNNNNMGIDNNLGNKSRLPLWLDHHQVMNSDSFLASSSCIGGSGHVLSEFSPANSNLFASSSSSTIPQGPTLLKEEEDNRGRYHNASELFSLYSLPCSSTGNMSATALLQKAAQIGSTRSNSNSATMFANTPGIMRSSTSSSSPSFSNNLANLNNVDIFHQKQLFRQQMNHQLAGLHGYSTTNDQLQMTSNNKSSSDGMRDFLGTLGGGARNDGNNGGGEEEERRVLLEEEMAYKFASMEGSHDHQEPYKDLMR